MSAAFFSGADASDVEYPMFIEAEKKRTAESAGSEVLVGKRLRGFAAFPSDVRREVARKANLASRGRAGRKTPDLTGQRFGALTALRRDAPDKDGKPTWFCQCDCGGIKVVRAAYLVSGNNTSCGAPHHRERHGEAGTPLWSVWMSMRERCGNPNSRAYANYGGRGITVCDRWQTYENFRDDMALSYARGLQLDRIDNNGPYSPENCRWVTRKENNRNKRTNVFVRLNGRLVTLTEASELTGIPAGTLSGRYHKGYREDTGLFAQSLVRPGTRRFYGRNS